jgi:hypothetical protein
MHQSQNHHIPNFVNLCKKIEEYNRKHTSGAQADRLLAALMVAASPQETASPAKEAEAIFKEFTQTLSAMGLEVVQNRGESQMAQLARRSGEHPVVQGFKSNTLSLDVADAEQLVRFFNSITPRDLGDSESSKAINFLAKALDDEFIHRFKEALFNEEEGSWGTLQDPLLAVASMLQTLNLKEAADRLTLHVEQAIDGALVEYLNAENEHILEDNGGFNARRWHLAATPDFYQDKWHKAFEAAELISTNDKAAKIFDQVHKFLTESAEFAKDEITKIMANPPSNYSEDYWKSNGPQFLETLTGVLRELAILKSARAE